MSLCCAVLGCEKTFHVVPLHSFPRLKQRGRFILWIKATGNGQLLQQEPDSVQRLSKICAVHFVPYSGHEINRQMHHFPRDAIPTTNLPWERRTIQTPDSLQLRLLQYSKKKKKSIIIVNSFSSGI